MADCSPEVAIGMANSQLSNQKIQQDSFASRENQSAVDNQENAREVTANHRAWEAIKLEQAQIANRRAQNAATADKLADTINLLAIAAGQIATQAGQTEAQQTVSPAGTATSEAIKGAVGTAAAGEAVSAEAVTASVANLASSLVPVIASAVATATAQTLAAVLPVLVTAIGGASTPSQTKPPIGSGS